MALSATDHEAHAKTGILGLDAVLTGGLPRDRIYLVEGAPGTGKTTLALQFSRAGVQAGERCLYVTLSETRAEIEATARSHGWSLDDLVLIELSAMDQTAMLEQESTIFESSQVELQETTQWLLQHIESSDPDRVVIDSLSELRLMAQSPLRYRRQLLGFKQHFAGKRCTVLLLDECANDPRDLQLQSMAHGVLHLERVVPMYGEDRRRLRVLKLRGQGFCGGYHDFVIRCGGLAVFPRVLSVERDAGFERSLVTSGVRELDHLLGGGLDRGTCALLVGPSGVGKSAVATQFAVAAAERSEHVALFAFDESLGTLRERARGLGLPIDERVTLRQIRLRHIDAAEMCPGEFGHLAHAAVDDGAQLVIIDSLNGYASMMDDVSLVTRQLHELVSSLGQRGACILLIMGQHGLLGGTGSPADISFLCDTVLVLRYCELGGRIRRAISVIKRRCGPHGDAIRELSIGEGGVQVGDPLWRVEGAGTGASRLSGEDTGLHGNG